MSALCQSPPPQGTWATHGARRRAAARWRRHSSTGGSNTSASEEQRPASDSSQLQSASGAAAESSSSAPQRQQPPADDGSLSRSAGSGSGGTGSSTAGGGGSGSGSVSTFNRRPWQLMGRMVSSERIALTTDSHISQGLVRSAAARESGLEYEEFELRLERLFTLMPALQPRLPRMAPKLVAALAADPDALVGRLIQLKALLPDADVAGIAAHRPSLLLAGEWEAVGGCVAALLEHYSQEDACRLATAEPLLLAENVNQVLEELRRLMPVREPLSALLQQPRLASTVSRLAHLSLW